MNFQESIENHHENPNNDSQFLISWNNVEKSLPWGLMFMLGGAFAISDATMVS